MRTPGPVVLVADDEVEIRDLVADILSINGFEMLAAGDGAEAVELAVAHRPALVLLDVMMPTMDGYTALTQLRGHSATRDIPVIVLTGQGEAFRNLSAGVGADAHVAKPFSPGQLTETVQRVLAERDARRAAEGGLGELLVERGLITAVDLEAAVGARAEEGKALDALLLERGLVAADVLERLLGEILAVPRVDLDAELVDLDLARALPEEVLRRRLAVPLRRAGQELTVVFADPADRQAVLELEALTSARVVRVTAARAAVLCLLDRAFAPSAGTARSRAVEVAGATTLVETDPTGVAQVYALLLGALREEATEIHIEPLPQQIRVRNRIGTRLVERTRLPRTLLEPIIARFRVLAGLGDEDPPQQAYMRTRLEGQEVELELEFLASLHGESVTIRLWRQGLIDPDPILGEAITRNASDVYLLEGTPPTLKVDGVAMALPAAPPLGAADLRKLVLRLMPDTSRKTFESTGEADLSFVHPQFGRFRLNTYRAMGATGMVLRRVKTELPTFETLDLPAILGSLVMERQGLLLLVGATGSGKSTTCAAMIDYRNTHAAGHIVTIEDPVEFIHPRKRSVISQREVGVDTGSYLVALHKALRQAPDVIFVGELRDRETVSIALHSAETGHLVISTLHATNATGTLERLLNFFPPEAREATLMQISLLLRAAIAQRLVPRVGGRGRVAAMEIMINTPRIQALIRRGELETIRQAIEEGAHEGLQTMDQSLLGLYQQGKISQEDALRFADSPNNLRLRIKGIK